MDKMTLIPAAAGLVGALFGAMGGVAGQWIIAGYNKKNERLKLTVQLALADQQARAEAIKNKLLPEGQRVPPLPAFVDYNARILDLLAKGPPDCPRH